MVSFSSIISLSIFFVARIISSFLSFSPPIILRIESCFTSSNIFMTELLVVFRWMSSIFTFIDGQIWKVNVYLSIILNIIMHRCQDFLSPWNRRQAIILSACFFIDFRSSSILLCINKNEVFYSLLVPLAETFNFCLFIVSFTTFPPSSTTPPLPAPLILSLFSLFFWNDHPPFHLQHYFYCIHFGICTWLCTSSSTTIFVVGTCTILCKIYISFVWFRIYPPSS